MSLCNVLIAALATWQIVEVWRHGSLFRDARDALSVLYGAPRLWLLTRWLVHVLLCPWCLSIYVALIVVAYCELAPGLLGVWSLIPVHALAVSRIANLLNDATYKITRTPKDAPPS